MMRHLIVLSIFACVFASGAQARTEVSSCGAIFFGTLVHIGSRTPDSQHKDSYRCPIELSADNGKTYRGSAFENAGYDPPTLCSLPVGKKVLLRDMRNPCDPPISIEEAKQLNRSASEIEFHLMAMAPSIPIPNSEAACKKVAGAWEPDGMKLTCVVKTSDAGKACDKSFECESSCYWGKCYGSWTSSSFRTHFYK